MTSLLPGSASTRATAARGRGAGPRLPLVPVALGGGVVAALATLAVCLAVGVAGWFLADAGVHGTPRDGLRIGALGWLLAHGSGVHVAGVAVTVIPLGLSAACAWTVWRVAHRVGTLVSGHGPDADRIADGERDWTVAIATVAFLGGYLLVAAVTLAVAGDAETAPSGLRVTLWTIVLGLAFGATAIATGSGRAAIWAPAVAGWLRAACAAGLRILVYLLLAATLLFLAALLVDLDAAVNVMSQLHTGAGDAVVYGGLSATMIPNAAVFAAAYLLGPGFAVGAGTVVSPSLVSLGPVPMFPLLAALPDDGPTPAWTGSLLAVPVLLAALGAVVTQRRVPTLRWEEGALRGCVGGVLAGLLLAVLAALSGGAAGPGRMRVVGPETGDVLVHAVAACGLGGVLGGLAMTWWQRRAARRASLDSGA